MEFKNKQVDFSKTTFYKGMNVSFGKVPVCLNVFLDILDIQNSMQNDGRIAVDGENREVQSSRNLLRIRLSVGSDKMYDVNDMGRFLDAFGNQQVYHFSKNFIFEPEKMYFQRLDRKLLEFLYRMKMRREYNQMNLLMISHTQKQDFRRNEIIFEEDECERLLDIIWEDLKDIRMQKHLEPILFENDIKLNIKVEKNGSFNLMSVDYSQYGNFEPLTINFRYIYIERKRLIIKLPEEKRELMMNLYNFKNDDNVVCFKISESEKYLFRKTFLDSYSDALGIDIEKKVIEEMEAISLLTKVYVDIASKGIISMVEFCYGDKVINPLYDAGFDKGFREAGCENEVLSQLKSYGFKEHGRLFLLDDAEQIMFLLTDKLEGLKKIAEVYYSVDFKKLYVKNLNSLGLSLSEDESVIHMNINLENVSDEELAELLEAIKTGKKYYRLKNGSIVNLGSADSSKLVDLINSLDINKDSINGGIFEIPLNRGVYIDNYLREKNVENVKIDSQLGYLLKRLSNPDDMEVKLNGNLKEVLRNYQMTGVKWLQTMASCSFGGILADDMGLGKTLQVLAFIAAEKCKEQKDGKKPCIVVAPTSIIYNWKSEAEKFTPELKVLVITGLKDKRRLLICGCNDFDLIITSYGALKNDVQDYEKIKFLYIFLDEAQNIKNPATLNANSVKSLSGKCAFALTGTPIENRLMELWSIFDFIMPGLLFDRIKFARIYEDPIMREKDSKKMEELSHIIRPFIIRRMKRDVLSELPEKLEANYLAEMKEEQKKLYAAFYKDFKNELIPKINEFGIGKNHIEIFSALTRLRQICAHPGTFLENYSGGSGKLDLAMDIIYKSIETGHSILLFSQFTKMLKIVRNELEKNNVNYYYLDGKMKPEERMVEIDNFNYDKEAVFLISLKAGGTGLNLTKADVVIHFDPWWNPAVENQASDRAYRIGQKNVVQVYNLLTEGTIEEMIARLKERKRDLFDGVIKSEENFLYQLSEEEIKNLFNLSGGESARNSM